MLYCAFISFVALWLFSSVSFASSTHTINFSRGAPQNSTVYQGLSGSSLLNSAGLSTFTGGVSITQSITTSYSNAASSSTPTSTQGSQVQTSPTSSVAAANAQNSTNFLTCTAPKSPSTDNSLFIPASGGFVGGATCLNTVSSMTTGVELDTQIRDTFNNFQDPLDLASFTVLPLKLTNLANLQLKVYTYSPEVDGELSNGYATNSYIFQSVPSFAQNAIWSWTTTFPDFSKVTSGNSDYQMDDEIWTDGITTLSYSYEVKTTLNWVHNTYLPFLFAPNGLAAMTQSPSSGSTTPPTPTKITTPVFPYLFYNFNLTMNSPATFVTPNLTTLSYGIFTPATYYAPNMMDQFPLDVPSLFISNFATDPSGTSYSANTLPSHDIGIGIDQPPSNTFGSNYNLVSIAATPNDYVFLLLNSTSSAPQGSGKYYIGVARDIASGYYQAGSSNAVGLRGMLPGVVSCTTESSCQTSWNNEWNTYWSKDLVQQGSSLFLLSTPSGSSGSTLSSILNTLLPGSSTTAGASSLIPLSGISASNLIPVSGIPMNITVDYLGDAFVVGQQSSGGDTYLAKFQNNNVNSICSASSCFTATYNDITTGTPLGSSFSGATSTSPGSKNDLAFAGSSCTCQQYLIGMCNTPPSTGCDSSTTTVTAGSPASSLTTTVASSCTCQQYVIGLCSTPPSTGCDSSSTTTITPPSTTPTGVQQDKFTMIAVSPTGDQVYIGVPTDGSVYVFSGNALGYESSINLAYALNPGGSTASSASSPGSSTSTTSASPLTATLNIGYWLANQGLYNQSLSFASSYAAPTGCANLLDKSTFHHPLGIADVNGYIYVLDNWIGLVGGSSGTSSTSSCSTASTAPEIAFDMMMLRAMNSTGTNIPIQPSFVNDLVSQNTCTPAPGSALAGNPNQCWTTPPAGGNANCPTQASSGTLCSLASIPGGCTFSSGSQYACVSSATGQSSTYYSLAVGNFYASNSYPPYGWALSANVESLGGSGSSGSGSSSDVSFCISSGCTYNPVNLAGSIVSNSVSPGSNTVTKYSGGYYPLGPSLIMGACSSGGTLSTITSVLTGGLLGGGGSCLPTGIDFSLNYNDTATILFPANGANSGNLGSTLGFGELLFTNFDIQNYTKLLSGTGPSVCYRADASADGCVYSANTANVMGPVYDLTDPFYYFENLGSQQVLAYANQYGSTYAGGTGAGSPTSSLSQACQDEINNAQLPVDCPGYQQTTIDLSNLGTLQNVAATQLYPANVPVLSSTVGGTALVPYAYSVTTSETFSNWNMESCATYPVVCAATEAFIIAKAGVQSAKDTGTKIYYDVGNSTPTSSAPNNAPVEGGASYLRYGNQNNNGYYQPNLSDIGVYLSPQLFFNLSTDRLFGGLYINASQSLNTNAQYVLNATQQLNYITNFYTVASNLNYQTINSVALNPPTNGPNAAAGLTNIQASTVNTGLSYVTQNTAALASGFGQVNLFNWYKQVVYNNLLKFFINSSDSSNFPYGYRRFVYVLQDRFDNDIYIPLDADISNQTTLTLNVNPVVSPLNSAQTNVLISGTIGYYTYNATSTVFVPLANAPVYLYYNNNIDYNGLATGTGQSSTQAINAQTAQLCAFGNPGATGVPKTCNLANPLTAGQAAEANVITYSANYISSGTCPVAPESLLYQQGFTCNIYGADNLPASCPAGATGQQSYCYIQDSQGDGLCTSQLGLIGVATSNTLGYFSSNVVSCGISTARILASYYGSPGPEPVQAQQAPIYLAANPSIPIVSGAAGLITSPTFLVSNYIWSPNQTGATVSLGLFELGYGNADLIEILGAIGLVGAVAALKLASNKRSSARKRRRS